jgi:hypothetical protein
MHFFVLKGLKKIAINDNMYASFFKEVDQGGAQTRILSISFIFSFFTTLPLSHSGSPCM